MVIISLHHYGTPPIQYLHQFKSLFYYVTPLLYHSVIYHPILMSLHHFFVTLCYSLHHHCIPLLYPPLIHYVTLLLCQSFVISCLQYKIYITPSLCHSFSTIFMSLHHYCPSFSTPFMPFHHYVTPSVHYVTSLLCHSFVTSFL